MQTKVLYNQAMRVIVGNNVTPEMLEQALKLDWSCYPKDYWLTFDKCKDYFNANNEIYIMLMEENELIGYINFSPISDEAYNKIRSGEYKDTYLEGKDIVSYNKKGFYNGYFSSVVVKAEYRKRGIATILMNELFKYLTVLSERGIFFKRIVADVLSDGGRVLIEKFGLKKIIDSSESLGIYEIQLVTDDENLSGVAKELNEIYMGMNNNG